MSAKRRTTSAASATRRSPRSSRRRSGRTAAAPAVQEPSPRILVIADQAIGRGLHAALAEIDAARDVVPSVSDLDEPMTAGAIAYVWSAIGTERGFGRPVARMKNTADLPIYAVVRDDAPDAVARGLYRAGVSGVFAWPREGLLLARYVAEMLSLRWVRGRANNADIALARSVRAHLRHLEVSAAPPLSVDVTDGRVTLRGSLATLADRDEIERRIERVPGVAGLDVQGVRIDPVPQPDARLRAACRRLIATRSDPQTVSAEVRNGRVRFQGVVADPRDARELRSLAAEVPGVREVELDMTTHPDRARRSRNVRRRLDALLRTLYPRAAFQLSCHGDVAVLDGDVPTLHVKRSMQRLLEQDPAVARVVNKLNVTS